MLNCIVTLAHVLMQSWAESRARGLQTYTQQQASKHSKQATGAAEAAATDSESDFRSVVDLTLLSDSDKESSLDSDVGRQIAEADQLQLQSGCKEEGQLQRQKEEQTECEKEEEEEEELMECQKQGQQELEEEDQLEYDSLQSELELNLDDTSEEEGSGR